MQSTLVLLLCSACAALQLRPAPTPLRHAAPAMQLFGKKPPAPKGGASTPRKGGSFYDDEVDTVSRKTYKPDVADNGEVDLATVGGVYYVAFIPFLLFVLAYASGIFSFGYEKGNF